VAAAYHDAERSAVRADEQRRSSVWEGLLTGVGEDPGFAFEAARILGLPVDGRYVVVVAEPASRDLEAVRRVRDRLAAGRVESVWQARGAALVGLLRVAKRDASRELAVLRDALEVRAGASSPVDGLEQAHTGFRQAALALRTLGPGDTFAVLDERLPEAMLVQFPELAQRLVDTWLGSLLELPNAERGPLLDTLDAWVETSGSAGRTARLVHCHRNTVLNRLRRLSEVTGHDLTGGVTPVELALALRARRLLAPPAS
jgi:DNA-binding PucR family transcriptional regulator